MQIFNKIDDLIFIRFPIIFPLLYYLILTYFPNYEIYLILIVIFLLAEPHFAATWPIFIDTGNKEYLKQKKLFLIYGTAIISMFSLVLFFYNKNIFFFIFYIANIYHVTRQSVGICKLYSKGGNGFNYQENSIYLFNILFVVIGFLRFYLNVDFLSEIFFLNLIVISLIIINFMIYFLLYKNLSNSLTMLTGILIFLPVCFVSKPIHVILMGVTMHYSQYLFITSKVNFARSGKIIKSSKELFFRLLRSKFLLFLLLYSIVMTIFSSLSNPNINYLSSLIIIPLVGQMIHFYVDSFIWKFSENHNREVTLKHIVS